MDINGKERRVRMRLTQLVGSAENLPENQPLLVGFSWVLEETEEEVNASAHCFRVDRPCPVLGRH